MAKQENQKLKIPYLMKIFSEKTDYGHGITMPQIIDELDSYGIHAERKGIYSDIDYLNEFGFEIESRKVGKNTEYYLVSRTFELAELKLLVDSVQSAKFITEKKSRELIKKLETLCSDSEAKQLNRQVYVQGRIKTMNESILYNVDAIHSAIGKNSKISFQYWNWSVDKKMELRKDGALYKVSPWGLSWDDENYYMVAFDDNEKKIKHYRVDKMLRINILDEKREGMDSYKGIDMADYSNKTFGMFGGEVKTVTIECDNSFAGVMIDRFGKDVFMRRVDDGHFSISAPVAISGQFIGWIIGLGDKVKVTGPDELIAMIKKEGARITKLYK